MPKIKGVKRMVKISVIVPVYNVEKYLERCMSSLLNQTFDDYEILLVDDGHCLNLPVFVLLLTSLYIVGFCIQRVVWRK